MPTGPSLHRPTNQRVTPQTNARVPEIPAVHTPSGGPLRRLESVGGGGGGLGRALG